jgi:hypothetical protein
MGAAQGPLSLHRLADSYQPNLQQNCHPDRSVAKWRDLLFPKRSSDAEEVIALPFVIPTRISCHAALDEAACALFRKEGRMKCDNATRFHRKSGGPKWRDLRFSRPFLEMFFHRA